MRLLIATPLYPPEIGGPATDAAALARYLRGRGEEVVIYPFSKVRTYPKLIRHLFYLIGLIARARGIGGIIAFDTVSVGLPAAIAARICRVPLIVRVPGDYAWEQGVQRFNIIDSIETFQHTRYGSSVELLRQIQKFVTSSAALVVVPSDYFKTIVSSWGVKTERHVCIYLGIDVTDAVTVPASKPAGKVLFSVGRFVPWKGFSLILKLLSECPDWQAVIAGDGPLRKTLEDQAQTLGVSGRVQFVGALPRAEVLGWCATADAFVLNTSFESFSFQVLEAMSVGSAIIATTAGSLPELITNGTEGILCRPNDLDSFKEALMSIDREAGLWEGRRSAAKLTAQKFSIDCSVELFTKELRKICT